MKNLILTLACIISLGANAQNFAGLDKSIMDIAYFPNGAHRVHMAKTAADKAKIMPKIKVIYSRPLAAGRKVFGELVKMDQAWRFGANESTEITLYTAAKIGESVLSPGRYTLYCVPSADKWTLNVHPNLDGWGNFGYDDSKAVASVTGAVSKSDQLIEAFSITLYEASPKTVHLKAGWENTIVEFPIELL